MDWESLYKVFLQYLQEHLDELEKGTEKFTEDFIKYLRENNYQITPEMQQTIDTYTKSMTETLQTSVFSIIENVAAAAAASKESKTLPVDEFVKNIAKEVFERKYPDGLSLSERIWSWEKEMKDGLKDVVSNGIRQGIGAKKLVYEMQYEIERLRRTEFANVLAEKTPKWLEELEASARTYIKNEDMREEWEKTVRKIEKYLKKLSRQGTYTASKTVFDEIIKAVEEGNTKLIDKAVKWWNYDKQLYRLKAIAQTENANAYHLSQIKATEYDPDIVGYQWRLSSSHPRPDICDVYANINYGLGKGVFPKDKVPRQKAHPFCLCYLLPKVKRKGMSEKETPEIPEDVLKRFAPKYIKSLNKAGYKLNNLFDYNLGAFKRKKDLIKEYGSKINYVFSAYSDKRYKRLTEIVGTGATSLHKKGDKIFLSGKKPAVREVLDIKEDILGNDTIFTKYSILHSLKKKGDQKKIAEHTMKYYGKWLKEPDLIVYDKKAGAVIYYRKVFDRYSGLVVGKESRIFYTVLVKSKIEGSRYEIIYKKH